MKREFTPGLPPDGGWDSKHERIKQREEEIRKVYGPKGGIEILDARGRSNPGLEAAVAFVKELKEMMVWPVPHPNLDIIPNDVGDDLLFQGLPEHTKLAEAFHNAKRVESVIQASGSGYYNLRMSFTDNDGKSIFSVAVRFSNKGKLVGVRSGQGEVKDVGYI